MKMDKDIKPAWTSEFKPRYVPPRAHLTTTSEISHTKISPTDGYTYKISRKIKNNSDWDSFPTSALEISLVGYKRLKDPEYSKSGKCIWVLMHCCCIVTLAYYVTTRVSYMNFHSLVSNMVIERYAKVEFPSMTLCPSGIYLFLYAMGVGTAPEEVKFRDLFYELLFKNNTDTERILGPSYLIKDAISAYIPCKDNDVDCEMRTGKNINITMQTIETFWGRCIAISTDVELLFRGPFSYLRIMVNMSAMESPFVKTVKRILQSMNDTTNLYLKPTILYHVYPKGFEASKHDIFYFGLTAAANTRLNLQLSYTKFMFHNSSTRVCLKPEEVTLCRNKFIDKIIEDKLPCSPQFIDYISKKQCYSMNDSFVVFKHAYKIYSTLNLASFTCPEACNTTSYSVTKLIEDNYLDDTVEFKIFYLEESYELTKETIAYHLMDYVSDIGGMFGFFLGFCLLSILELIDFLIHWIWKKSKDCKKCQT